MTLSSLVYQWTHFDTRSNESTYPGFFFLFIIRLLTLKYRYLNALFVSSGIAAIIVMVCVTVVPTI